MKPGVLVPADTRRLPGPSARSRGPGGQRPHDTRRVVDSPIIAHRGASAEAPENTRAAIELAAELGARWVEIDVQLTADDELVVIHDATVDRTTDGTGAVLDLTLAQLRELDAGSWFDPAFAGQRIPTLDDVVRCCLEHDLHLQLELKPARGNDRELTRRALQRFASLWPSTHHHRALITSFSTICLRDARARLPSVARAVAVTAIPDDPWTVLRNAGADVLHVLDDGSAVADYRRLSASGVEYAVAIVNDPDRARALLDARCQSILTDRPDLLDR